jgi:CRISPR-associated exonuclease Cas4
MNGEGLAVLVALIFITSLFLFYRGHRTQEARDQRGLPDELQGAEIAYAERTFRSRRRKLVARLDRAYRIEGVLKLVELKTRSRDVVYMADIIELSVQRIALQDESGQAVARDAWVIVQGSTTSTRRPHRVTLLGVNDIENIRERYVAISRGQIRDPQAARSIRQCETCGHRDRCVATFSVRGPDPREGAPFGAGPNGSVSSQSIAETKYASR